MQKIFDLCRNLLYNIITFTKGKFMADYNDFVLTFLKNYDIDGDKQQLSEEDKLFFLHVFDSLKNQIEDDKDFLHEIKLRYYNSYYNFADKPSLEITENIDQEIEEKFNAFCTEDIENKSGIGYSDIKQALKAEKELFDDNIISSLSVAKGIDVTKIKLALQPKLDEYLQEKLNYVKLAFKHLHSLYSYNTSEK